MTAGRDDLGATVTVTVIDIGEILAVLEDAFGMSISVEQAERTQTVQGAVSFPESVGAPKEAVARREAGDRRRVCGRGRRQCIRRPAGRTG